MVYAYHHDAAAQAVHDHGHGHSQPAALANASSSLRDTLLYGAPGLTAEVTRAGRIAAVTLHRGW
jgi:hypothetical protein